MPQYDIVILATLHNKKKRLIKTNQPFLSLMNVFFFIINIKRAYTITIRCILHTDKGRFDK